MNRKTKLPTWVLTIVLCILTIIGTLAAIVAIYFNDIGVYSYRSAGYLRLSNAEYALRSAAIDIAAAYDDAQWQGVDEVLESESVQSLLERFSPENSNLLFAVYDDMYETVHLSNFNGWDSRENETIDGLLYGGDMNYDHYGTLTEYTSNGYIYIFMGIRDPMTTADIFSYAKAQFGELTAYRAVPFIVIAACVALYVLVCVLWSRRILKKEPREALSTYILRILPADLMFILLVLAAVLALFGTAISISGAYGLNFGGVVTGTIICLCFMLLCLLYLYMLLLQRREKRILRNTALGRIAVVLRRTDTRLPIIVLVCLLVLAYGISAFVLLVMALNYYSVVSLLFWLVLFLTSGACLLAAIYSVYCANGLARSARQVAGGNYHIEIDKTRLFGPYKEIADELENTTNGLNLAVAEQMKSERMKTELITNVSHDIKTPLTSIVNYVDLLRRLALENEQAEEYLEVLDRQSLRLKKLAEDIVEASRAASGDMAVELAPVDVGELLRQAVAEYAARYEQKGLDCIVNADNITVLADGGLLWRVLDNLLGNAEKYALPGTRVYIDVEGDEGDETLVRMTLRNISAQPLNISADELMERFVRGDEARSETGSGLGLSISRSLLEIQGGRFALTVDGDLFKVSLWLPRA